MKKRYHYNNNLYTIEVYNTNKDTIPNKLTHKNLKSWEIDYVKFHPNLKVLNIRRQ